MEQEPGLWIHLLLLGLGVVPVDRLQFPQQVLNFLRKAGLDFHETAPGMGEAVGQDGIQFPSLAHGVGGQGIAHLNGYGQALRPVLEDGP
jgi:hypothetical protein